MPHRKHGYWLNLLVGVDQLLNALFGGDCDETVSSRIGRLKLRHNGNIPWSYPVPKLLEYLLNKIDNNHCTKVIEEVDE